MFYASALVLIAVLVLIQVRRTHEIELQILSVILRQGEMYGLQIADALQQNFGREPGWEVLYPALRRLERQGFVVARWGKERPEERGGARRKYYRRTGKRSKLKNRKPANLRLAFSQPSINNLIPRSSAGKQ